MKYLKTFEQKLADMPPHLAEIDMDPDLGDQTATADETEMGTPGVIDKEVHWYAMMSGDGDYVLTYKNSEGEDVQGAFKDTGNRRSMGSELRAAFLGMGKASDGGHYVAEAIMKKNSEGCYEVEKFVVYEH